MDKNKNGRELKLPIFVEDAHETERLLKRGGEIISSFKTTQIC